MYRSAHDIKAFYNTRTGRVVRRLIKNRISALWPEESLKGQTLVGCGYAVPYLHSYIDKAERVAAVMPAGLGAHRWPQDGAGLVCLSEESELPFETGSVDRVLLVHSMEYAELLQPNLHEIWRVLKGNGRLLLVVPSRLGFWARADWCPFGHGTPYTLNQVLHYLRDSYFVHERTEKALFMPPMRTILGLEASRLFERFGPYVWPALAGVHIVEASKQIYGGVRDSKPAFARIRGRMTIARPAPVAQQG